MAIDYAALKSEIQADPTILGYAPFVTAGSDIGVAGLLNATRAGISVFRNDLGVREVINAIDATNFASLTQIQVSKLMLLFTSTPTIDATNANTRTIFLGIFSGMTATVNALTALASRTGSRAEQLFGAGTVVGHLDVARALRG
jgi:hypothetical protein